MAVSVFIIYIQRATKWDMVRVNQWFIHAKCARNDIFSGMFSMVFTKCEHHPQKVNTPRPKVNTQPNTREKVFFNTYEVWPSQYSLSTFKGLQNEIWHVSTSNLYMQNLRETKYFRGCSVWCSPYVNTTLKGWTPPVQRWTPYRTPLKKFFLITSEVWLSQYSLSIFKVLQNEIWHVSTSDLYMQNLRETKHFRGCSVWCSPYVNVFTFGGGLFSFWEGCSPMCAYMSHTYVNTHIKSRTRSLQRWTRYQIPMQMFFTCFGTVTDAVFIIYNHNVTKWDTTHVEQ